MMDVYYVLGGTALKAQLWRSLCIVMLYVHPGALYSFEQGKLGVLTVRI